MSRKRPAAGEVLLDLHCAVDSAEGRGLECPPGLGASLVKRKGGYWLRLGADLLQPYNQLPAQLWNGGNLTHVAAERRRKQFEETGAVRPLQALMLRACPGAAGAAERAAMAEPLRDTFWDTFPEVHDWVDTQLVEYDSRGQKQPALLTGVLAPYQLSALRFMLDRERNDFRDDMWTEVQAASGQRLWYSPGFGRLSPTEPPSGTCGGILADYMGLGKTVMALSLVAATMQQQRRPTLVVCPPGLVDQWRREVERWLPGVDCVVLTGKHSLAHQLAGRNGVALVPYTKLRRIDVSGAQLHRVILDEAHTIGSARPPSPSVHNLVATVTVCASINAPRRWALTGTPVTSRHSVHSILMALRVASFSDWQFSRSMVFCAVGSASYFGAQLAACMLRRNEALLQSQLGVEVVRHPTQAVELSAAERRVYKATSWAGSALHAQGTTLALRRLAAGGSISAATISSGAWLQVRAYQWDHAAAATRPTAAQPTVDPTVSNEPRCADGCPICLSEPVRSPEAATPCKHCFCSECLMQWLRAGSRRCPICRVSFRVSALRIAAPLPEPQPPQPPQHPQHLWQPRPPRMEELAAAVDALPRDPERDDRVLLSSKPTAIAAKVREILAADDGAAVLVFSHFADTLRLVSTLLQRDDVASLLGPRETRQGEIDRFQNGEARVLLLPYTSRLSSGINLTAANHIVLSERAVNPGEEGQAIGRARRIGQKREVNVWLFEAPNTVDAR